MQGSESEPFTVVYDAEARIGRDLLLHGPIAYRQFRSSLGSITRPCEFMATLSARQLCYVADWHHLYRVFRFLRLGQVMRLIRVWRLSCCCLVRVTASQERKV